MRVTDEMVEAAARAQCASQGGYDPDEKMANDGPRWHYYVPLARAALEAALAVEGTRGGPVAYRHTIMEPDKSEPQVLLSFSVKNPWSHWVAAHRDKCSYHVTPLYTTPPAGIREALEYPQHVDRFDVLLEMGDPICDEAHAEIKALRAALRGQS